MSALDVIKSEMLQCWRPEADRLQPSIDRLTALARNGYQFASGGTDEQKDHALLVTNKLTSQQCGLELISVEVTSLRAVTTPKKLLSLEGERVIGYINEFAINQHYPAGVRQKALWTEFGQALHESFRSAVYDAIGADLAYLRWDHEFIQPISFHQVMWSCLWTTFLQEVTLTLCHQYGTADEVRDYLEILCQGFFAHSLDRKKPSTLLAFTA
jgi:hypothetical protein